MRLDKEQNYCRNELSSLDDKGVINFQSIGYATTDQIRRELNRYLHQVYIFHYGGHSSSELLKLPEGGGNVEYLGKKIADQRNLKLVFLNGCKNYEQVEVLLDFGVPAVIATTAKVDDESALELAQKFYQELAAGNSIQTSFEHAKNDLIDNNTELKRKFRDTGWDDEKTTAFAWGLYTHPEKDWINDWRIDSIERSINNQKTFGNTTTIINNGNVGKQINDLTVKGDFHM